MRWPSLFSSDANLVEWSRRLKSAVQDAIAGIPGGTPFAGPMADVAAAQTPGTSDAYARGDHAHGHGSQAGGTTHAEADAGQAGFLSVALWNKLSSIVAGHVIADHGTFMPQRGTLYIRGLFVDDEPIDDHTLVQFPIQLTSAQRRAYGPVRGFPGCAVFDTDQGRMCFYDGRNWRM